MEQVRLVTDGACLGNPGPGGWAALLKWADEEKMITGSEADSTNNRMEISAVLFGLKELTDPCQVHIVADSKYVIDAFDKGWIVNWKTNGWLTAARKPVKNKDLWQELDIQINRHKIRWTWVKGHSGNPEIERVDQAARQAAEKQ